METNELSWTKKKWEKVREKKQIKNSDHEWNKDSIRIEKVITIYDVETNADDPQTLWSWW